VDKILFSDQETTAFTIYSQCSSF